MTKTIFFDFWGTLVEQGVWSPIKQVQRILDIRIPFSEYVTRMQKAMMTSSFSELREAFNAVGKEFEISISEKKMEELIGMWNTSWMLAVLYEETVQALSELREEYTLVLVCNTDQFSVERVLDKFNMKAHFNHIFLSYQEGSLKTDEQFFPAILAKLNVSADDCVMVGDSIQSDILPAERAGLKTLLVDRKGRQESDKKIRNLRELTEVL